MKNLIFVLPLMLVLIGCDKKTKNDSSGDMPIDTYRKGIDRAQEVQQKSSERAKTLDSISQGDQ